MCVWGVLIILNSERTINIGIWRSHTKKYSKFCVKYSQKKSNLDTILSLYYTKPDDITKISQNN